MGRIARLPPEVANQIAAGEVVERPAAVVKELVENALDAGARRVEVAFRRGGKSLIRVGDDGCGMDAEDALLALEPHATSKIRCAADLGQLRTFGFRGEALASIASVSDFTLRTRAVGADVGTEVRLNGSRVPEVRSCGAPVGTTVEVAALFRPTPARRKFLKTDETEAAHIVELCRLLALANPEVALCLVEDGRVVFESPGEIDLRARVADIFGRRLAAELLDLDVEADGLRVRGLVGPPGLSRATRADIRNFVNRRPVDSRLLTYAVLEGYHGYQPRGRYPVVFLFVDIDPARVDVNVHPAKREVRFREEGIVRQRVIEVLRDRLQRAEGERLPLGRAVAALESSLPPRALPMAPGAAPPRDPVAPPARTFEPPSPSPPPSPRALTAPPPAPDPEASPVAPAPSPSPRPGWPFVGRWRRRVLIFAAPEGLVAVHATAAWERILHERFRRLWGEGGARQQVLFPPLIELDPLLDRACQELRPLFDAIGFVLEPFGRRLYRLAALPEGVDLDQGEALFRDCLQLAQERGLGPHRQAEALEALARRVAEREAPRQATPRDEGEAGRLLEALFRCAEPWRAPDGRATIQEWRWGELEKAFGRELAPD